MLAGGAAGSGDVLGESCLGRVRKHTENATTMEEAEIVRIPLRVVHEFIASDPAMGPAAPGLDADLTAAAALSLSAGVGRSRYCPSMIMSL